MIDRIENSKLIEAMQTIQYLEAHGGISDKTVEALDVAVAAIATVCRIQTSSHLVKDPAQKELIKFFSNVLMARKWE